MSSGDVQARLGTMFRCHFCESRSYYQVDRGFIEGCFTRLEGRIVFCAGCGWLEFFLEDPAEWAKRNGATLYVPESDGTYR